jgi:hypothetical protein
LGCSLRWLHCVSWWEDWSYTSIMADSKMEPLQDLKMLTTLVAVNLVACIMFKQAVKQTHVRILKFFYWITWGPCIYVRLLCYHVDFSCVMFSPSWCRWIYFVIGTLCVIWIFLSYDAQFFGERILWIEFILLLETVKHVTGSPFICWISSFLSWRGTYWCTVHICK